jgi:hypothetical protein
MNYIFLPFVLCPVFCGDPITTDPLVHVVYAPLYIKGDRKPGYVFISEDYQPYTHHYYPEDGSAAYGEDEPIEWSS